MPWYESIREAVAGLEKNAFAGVNYSVSLTVVSSLSAVLLDVWPFVAVFLTRGATQLIYAATVVGLLALCWRIASWIGLRRRSAFGFPVAVLIFVYIQWRTMFLTLKNRGIRWRDTHYPLDELKANQV